MAGGPRHLRPNISLASANTLPPSSLPASGRGEQLQAIMLAVKAIMLAVSRVLEVVRQDKILVTRLRVVVVDKNLVVRTAVLCKILTVKVQVVAMVTKSHTSPLVKVANLGVLLTAQLSTKSIGGPQ